MATRMQQRRGTAQQWLDADPVLAAGEIGFETDTNEFRIGDGVNVWSDLSPFKNLEDLGGSLDDYVTVASKGQVNGVAPLGSNGQIPIAFLADLIDEAPEALNTLGEIADLLTTVQSSVSSSVAAHSGDTTNVHGIADTANLAYQADITTHNTDTTNVHGIANTADLATKTYADSAVSTHNSDTTSVHGISNTADLALQDDVTGAVSAHNDETENVHGIADTSLLITTTAMASAITTHNDDTTSVHGIADTTALATKTYADGKASDAQTAAISAAATAADGKVSDHNADTTSVHGIADTTALATKTYADGAVSTAVSALTKSSVGLGNVDNTSDASKPVSTATQTALDLKAPLANPTFTGTVSGITKSMVGLANVTNTADADKPVSSATQTALDLKANLAGPTFTGTVTLPANTITNSMMADDSVDTAEIKNSAVTNAKLAGSIGWDKLSVSSTVSSTELGYVDGVTSAIQTQLDSKLPLAGGTMTGALTLSGAPTSDLHAATKLYVDNVTAGINFHESVHAASTTNLATIYANGTSGVGATLTANTNRAFATLDGESVTLGQRVLIKDQTDAKQNGIYTLTTVGSVSAPWVLTRATDADNNPTGELKAGDFCLVINGTVNAGYGYINNSTANPIVIGTDNITYTAFSAGKTVTAGSGLTESTPGTLDIATGGVTSAMIADGTIVDADINASAAIAKTKISGTAITAADSGTVTSAMIADGTIVDGDINASAAIAQSKISGLTSALSAKAPVDAPTFTNLVTVAASGVAFTDGTQTKAGVPSITSFATAISSSATLASGQQDKFVPLTGGVQITLPATGYSTGQSIDFYQESGTGASFASTNGVVGTPGLKFRTTNSVVTAMKTSAGWLVFGDLSL